MADLKFQPCQSELVVVEDRDQSRIRTGKVRKAKCQYEWLLHVVVPRVHDWKIMLILRDVSQRPGLRQPLNNPP